jgi:branched-chain amino acid transport system ATP-binding protein
MSGRADIDDTLLLQARNLSLSFGGVLAVNDVSFDVRRGEVFTLIGPNGAGKTTVFNIISGIYPPSKGTLRYFGRGHGVSLTDLAPHDIAATGIARTFQNIELFEHASVLQNLLIGRHRHQKSGFWQQVFFTKTVREAEITARRHVESVIELLDLQHYRDTMVAGLP